MDRVQDLEIQINEASSQEALHKNSVSQNNAEQKRWIDVLVFITGQAVMNTDFLPSNLSHLH